MDLQDKVAVVTGASSGLGKEVAELLLSEGCTVFGLSRNINDSNLPDAITKIPLTIQDTKSVADAFSVLDSQTERIDILVNCAGRGLVKMLEETATEDIEEVLNTNLKGNIVVAQEAYKRMIPNKTGHIINVVSTSGIKARLDEPIYCASKWGLRGFTESLRLAAAQHQIRVTGVYPGGMQTNFWNGGDPRDTSKYMKPEDIALEVVHILKTPSSLSPAEYIIERGF